MVQSHNSDGILSAQDIERKLQKSPQDLQLKEELAATLLERYLNGEKGVSAANESDITKVRKLLAELPQDVALYTRALVAYVDNKHDETIRWLVKYATQPDKDGTPPAIGPDELLQDVLQPFVGISKGSWRKLADEFAKVWPDSPAVHTLRGMEKAVHENNPGEAIDCYVTALAKDEDYWIAALSCANLYFETGNWGAARGFYLKVMQSAAGRNQPAFHWSLAFCCGKLKDYPREEQYYRSCLELDPDFPALNNLGWSLMKQGRYAEALKVFEDCIERKQSGRYPLRNRARALTKLGRYPEAIEAWKRSSPKGKLSKLTEERIASLGKLIEKQRRGEPVTLNDQVGDIERDGGEGLETPSQIRTSVEGPPEASRTKVMISTEQSLEELIEDLILRQGEFDGRKLKMFTSPAGIYGRQYAIPGIGRIDLLTEDLETGDLVVIELKRDEGHDRVVGQISLYLSWVRDNLSRPGQNVVGIICVPKASERLKLAAKTISELSVIEYDFGFRTV